MGRYTGAKCRLCRREGTKLFLKGARCLSDKCGIEKRNQVPGPKRLRTRRGHSEFGKHLREKQKVKRIYGLMEAQFRKYYEEAAKKRGVTGQMLLQFLETRLDSVLYNAGFATSRNEARQKIRQNKVQVNGITVNIPSSRVKKGDLIVFSKIETSPRASEDMPVWMHWNNDKKAIQILGVPTRDDVKYEIDEHLIVEYYSR